MARDADSLVYSTGGSHRPGDVVPAQTRLTLRLDSKGRRGKSVTLVAGLAAHPSYAQDLLRQLKAQCGCGGTVKDGTLELQGDHRDPVQAFLERLGFPVKRAGG